MLNSLTRNIRVGIVDDSPLIRAMLKDGLSKESGIEIAGEAADPFEAREMIKTTNPDIITLDIEMPKMNGIDFLEKIMTLRPMPVIMFSSLTVKSADVTVRALELGAVDTVAKPSGTDGVSVEDVIRNELIPRIKAIGTNGISRDLASSGHVARVQGKRRKVETDLIGIASSTGGIERLRFLASGIKADIPPILIVQHINRHYIKSLVGRMNEKSPDYITVKLAGHNEPLKRNTIYFADNSHHLEVKKGISGFKSILIKGEPLGGFIASAEYLFESMAREAGKRSTGIILSGMGNDGSKGLLSLHNTGAMTIGESEASCLVYGMPKAAQTAGALKQSLSLRKILEYINDKL